MQLRPSAYLIAIDTLDPERVLLVHGYSRAMDLVSRRIASLLSDPRRSIPPEAVGESLRLLQERGYLVSESEQVEREGFTTLIEQIHVRQLRAHVPPLVLVPSWRCNLACPYCFERAPQAGSLFEERSTMTLEQVDAAFEAWERLAGRTGLDEPLSSDEGGRNAHRKDTAIRQEMEGRGSLLLYGGEPLLAAHRPQVERALRHARARGMDVRAVTNGTQLDRFTDLLGPAGIRSVQVTLDGPREIHDQRRVTHAGGATFERIASNIDRSLEAGAEIHLRMNVDRRNLEAIPVLQALFVERGWARHPRFASYLSPVHCGQDVPSNGNDMLTEEAIASSLRKAAQHKGFAPPMSGMEATIRSAITQVMEANVPVAYRTYGCSANLGSYLFDPNGRIWCCWEEMGPRAPVGRFGPGHLEVAPERLRRWQRSPIVARESCRRCAYAIFCGGGCDWHAEQQGTRYFEHYCRDFQAGFRRQTLEQYETVLAAVRQGVAHKAGDGQWSVPSEQWLELRQEVRGRLEGDRARNGV